MSRHSLAALIKAYRQGHTPQVLATVIATEGSSYRKAGARMLIESSDVVTGIVGGGCFDTDLIAQAEQVFADTKARNLIYDMRAAEEAIWGLGLGCNGAVRILLQWIDGQQHEPLYLLDRSQADRQGATLITVVQSDIPQLPVGYSWLQGDEPLSITAGQWQQTGCYHIDCDGQTIEIFVDCIPPPYHLLICGAGVDALAVVEAAASLGWRVTVLDHRPAYAEPLRFPQADAVQTFSGHLPQPLANCDAAVVMSHHLDTDRQYLQALSDSPIAYIGVLGPSDRRDNLLHMLGAQAASLASRLHGPAGLDLGGELPEEIALSVIAQIQAYRHRRGADGMGQPDLAEDLEQTLSQV